MSTVHRDDIQGLRGIAVLLVVAYHAGMPQLTGGYIGVDVFFVISGFVISGLLLRELLKPHPAPPRLDLRSFYARRMRRLLPAVTVVTAATLAASLLLGSPLEFLTHATSALFTTLYVSNLRFAQAATDYLAESAESDPFLHTWSLGVEEQFYLVWPLVFLLLFRLAPQRGRLLWVAIGCALLGTLSLLASDYLTSYNQPWGFFSPWTRAWEFALGAIGCCMAIVLAQRSNLLSSGLTLGGLAAVLYAAFTFDEHTRFPGTAALVPTLGAFALIIGPALGTGGLVTRVLRSAPLRLCGDLSYSWYLWHWPVLVYARILLPDLAFGGGIVCSILSFALAWLTLVTIENPFRSNRVLPLSPGRSILAGLAATAGTAACAGAVMHVALTELSTPGQIEIRRAREDLSIADGACHLQFRETDQPECRYGAKHGKRTLVLFGDSHARHWFPAFERLAHEHEWTIHTWTKSACPSIDVSTYLKNLGRTYRECATWREAIMDRLRKMHPDLVILANAESYVRDPSADGVDPAKWWAGLERTLASLDREGIPTLILGDTPWPGFDVPRCLSREAWRGHELDTACPFESPARNRPDDDANARRIVQRFMQVTFGPTHDLVCASPPCSPVRDGKVIYRDHSHMTAAFNRMLAEPLAAELAPRLPGLFEGGSVAGVDE
ncbi:MAG: acyltransferase [Gammaproteobacteria bacterium]|nr:acyltransferase [Gammaproteobacteria bacterium]